LFDFGEDAFGLVHWWRGDLGGDLRDRRSFKETAQRYLAIKSFSHARHHLSCKQRVPTKFKEVVVDADLVEFQKFRPDCCQLRFYRVPRSNKEMLQLRTALIRSGQCRSIKLPIRR